MESVSGRLQRHHDRGREPAVDRLVEAARRLFTDDGYSATSLEAIAVTCGLTKGSFYHHFRSKAELFEAVFDEEARHLCERVSELIAKQRTPWQAAYSGIRAFLEESQDPSVQRIMLLDGPSVLGWDRVREIEARYGLALIGGVVQRLIDTREIPAHDTDALAHLLFGALSEGALLIARSDDPLAVRRTVERELTRVLDGLAA